MKYTSAIFVLICAVGLLLWSFLPKDQGAQSLKSRSAAQLEARKALDRGQQLQAQGQLIEAVAEFDRVPQDAGELAVVARIAQASTLMSQGYLEKAEVQLDRLEKIAPEDPFMWDLRQSLLTASGRRWESRNYLRLLLKASTGKSRTYLIYLANLHEMPAPDEDYLERLVSVADAWGSLGAARIAIALNSDESAMIHLRRTLEARPDSTEAKVQFAGILLDHGRGADFQKYVMTLKPKDFEQPVIWMLQGRWAQEQGYEDIAIRCYWECLKRDPNFGRASYQLGQLLSKRGRTEVGTKFLERAGHLDLLREHATRLYEMATEHQSLIKVTEACRDLGRLLEAERWCSELERQDSVSLTKRAAEIRKTFPADGFLPVLSPEHDLAAHVNLSEFPLPDWNSMALTSAEPHLGNAVSDSSNSMVPDRKTSPFVLRDQAQELGINFVYENGDDPKSEGRRMFEYTGGGVGVVDLNNDLWPDVYFTQGSQWPPAEHWGEHFDGIFLNVRGEGFHEISRLVGIRDGGFGQGVSVGDYNNDGFSDIYLANIDGNRLFENLGDGTFMDVTGVSGLGHDGWTTSCLIADINQDSIPDIYDVTFLQGEDIFYRICTDEAGVSRSCAPAGFDAAPDHVYRGTGNGVFMPFSNTAGFDLEDGDGLGIVAADFDNNGTPSIFIANDGRPNFLIAPLKADPTTTIVETWADLAVTTGAAFDEEGRSQACMGVAAGDLNRDGFVDLFVTNFYQESNVLYENLNGSAFLDLTRTKGLRSPGYNNLGFGTQAIDLDLDGWKDLVVANGHVDDFTYKKIPHRMLPQVYRNIGGQRFEEEQSIQSGDYRSFKRLGRGLAGIDWNRDRRVDFAVTHLIDPVALVTNETESVYDSISVCLVGRNASRDALFTRVRLTCGDWEEVQHLTAGNGYQASCEKKLIFAIPDRSSPVSIRITWPDQSEQQFHTIQRNTDFLAIEGGERVFSVSP